MGIDIKYQVSEKGQKRDNRHIQEMNKQIREICDLLTESAERFSDERVKNVIKLIEEYISQNDRIAYSVISTYIFSLTSNMRGTFTTNLDAIVEFAFSEKYKKEFFSSERNQEEEIKTVVEGNNQNEKNIKIVVNNEFEKLQLEQKYKSNKKAILKLWDHAHLAIHQFENLKQSDEEFKKKFADNIAPVKSEVNNELNVFRKSIIAQLISLVAIFTAMSFLVFGGVNSLNEIFKDVKSIPILQIIIVGSVWGLCITNLIFVFMFFTSKLTDLNIKSSNNKEATLVQKYPLIFWNNLIIITILISCSWLNYIDNKNIGGWFVSLGNEYPKSVTITGLAIIALFFIVSSSILISKCRGNNQELRDKNREVVQNKSESGFDTVNAPG